MAAPRFAPSFKSQPHFGRISPSVLGRWVPTLSIWGVAAVGAGAVYLSSIPRFQKDVLMKVPFIASYYVDNTPDSDKPF